MTMTRRQLIRAALAAGSGALVSGTARSADDAWPNRPVTIVVPLAVGGVTDIVARYLGQKLAEEWKVPVVIENRLGAGGAVAAESVARAKADGYTLIMGTVSSHAINMSLYRNLRYDNLRDFEPVVLVSAGPNLLVVNPSLPVHTLPELLAYLKANPDKVSYGSTGVGTSTHVLAELFKMTTGTQMTHIPYKGSSQVMTDLVGGQVQLAFDNMPTALAQVRAGRLRPIALTASQRWPELPDTPTFAETLPGFVATSWQGLFAPAGTPAAALERISADAQRILKAPDAQKRFHELGTEAVGSSRQEFAGFVRSETERWAAVVRKSGARAD